MMAVIRRGAGPIYSVQIGAGFFLVQLQSWTRWRPTFKLYPIYLAFKRGSFDIWIDRVPHEEGPLGGSGANPLG